MIIILGQLQIRLNSAIKFVNNILKKSTCLNFKFSCCPDIDGSMISASKVRATWAPREFLIAKKSKNIITKTVLVFGICTSFLVLVIKDFIIQKFFGLSCSPNFTGSMTGLLYTSPSPRDKRQSRMPSSA